MKNIHVLPTDKETRLFTSDSELILAGYPATTFKTGKNIYITSDETPKLNDWFLDTIDKVVFKVTEEDILTMELDGLPFNFKKIILTTDKDLIADGVQAIDDEFLEWFVKNPSCEEVYVKDIRTILALQLGSPNGHLMYEIIIPKEEYKQETLEEVADRLYPNYLQEIFVEGAKWQQERMYNEEEVLDLLFKYVYNLLDNERPITENTAEEWFEQFKKK